MPFVSCSKLAADQAAQDAAIAASQAVQDAAIAALQAVSGTASTVPASGVSAGALPAGVTTTPASVVGFDAAALAAVPSATDTTQGKVALNLGTSAGDASNTTDALTAAGLAAILNGTAPNATPNALQAAVASTPSQYGTLAQTVAIGVGAPTVAPTAAAPATRITNTNGEVFDWTGTAWVYVGGGVTTLPDIALQTTAVPPDFSAPWSTLSPAITVTNPSSTRSLIVKPHTVSGYFYAGSMVAISGFVDSTLTANGVAINRGGAQLAGFVNGTVGRAAIGSLYHSPNGTYTIPAGGSAVLQLQTGAGFNPGGTNAGAVIGLELFVTNRVSFEMGA